MASEAAAINWQDKYIEKLGSDMDSMKRSIENLQNSMTNMQNSMQNSMTSMEARLIERIDAQGKQTQNLVLAMVLGIAAMTVAVVVAFVGVALR